MQRFGEAYLCVIAPADNTAPFEEMLQWWRAIGNTVSDLTGHRFEPETLRSNTIALPLDQLASYSNLIRYLRIQSARLERCLHWVA